MERTMLRYPCKPLPYKRYPYGFKYPCKKTIDDEEEEEEYVPAEGSAESAPAEGDEEVGGGQPRMSSAESRSHPMLRKQCSYPYFRRCRSFCRHRGYNLSWMRRRELEYEWEGESRDLACPSRKAMDSYEILCRIPFCKSQEMEEESMEPFNPAHCVFCDDSLYRRGIIYDLHEKVPIVKKRSEENGDDVAYRIGIRTRVTVHKSCYEEYIKRTYSDLEESDECVAVSHSSSGSRSCRS